MMLLRQNEIRPGIFSSGPGPVNAFLQLIKTQRQFMEIKCTRAVTGRPVELAFFPRLARQTFFEARLHHAGYQQTLQG